MNVHTKNNLELNNLLRSRDECHLEPRDAVFELWAFRDEVDAFHQSHDLWPSGFREWEIWEKSFIRMLIGRGSTSLDGSPDLGWPMRAKADERWGVSIAHCALGHLVYDIGNEVFTLWPRCRECGSSDLTIPHWGDCDGRGIDFCGVDTMLHRLAVCDSCLDRVEELRRNLGIAIEVVDLLRSFTDDDWGAASYRYGQSALQRLRLAITSTTIEKST